VTSIEGEVVDAALGMPVCRVVRAVELVVDAEVVELV
jgi:hypothetical protein